MAPSKNQPALPLPLPEIPRQPVYTVWPPRVESRESLDLLAAEIARVDALAERIAADAKEEIAAARNRAIERLKIEIEGRKEEQPLNLVDWRAALVAAGEKFCDRNRAALLEDGRKSLDLNHARAGWRDSPAGLEPLPDFDDDGNQKILKALLADLRKDLQKHADFADGGARFVDVKLAWRKKELLSAFNDQELSAAVLRKTGFAIRDEEENFYIEPRTGDVASQSAEKPK
jgi:hypothetical protein